MEDLPEDVLATVNDELAALRAEVSEATGSSANLFRLRVLGGAWSVRLRKKLTTDFGCYAKGKSVSQWCERTRFPERKSYAVNKYGMINAWRLAEEMVRRGDYFFSGWVDAGSPVPFDFTPLAQKYRPDEEYSLWFDDLPLSSPTSQAAFEIRDTAPFPLLE